MQQRDRDSDYIDGSEFAADREESVGNAKRLRTRIQRRRRHTQQQRVPHFSSPPQHMMQSVPWWWWLPPPPLAHASPAIHMSPPHGVAPWLINNYTGMVPSSFAEHEQPQQQTSGMEKARGETLDASVNNNGNVKPTSLREDAHAEEHLKELTTASVRIQRWYRNAMKVKRIRCTARRLRWIEATKDVVEQLCEEVLVREWIPQLLADVIRGSSSRWVQYSPDVQRALDLYDEIEGPVVSEMTRQITVQIVHETVQSYMQRRLHFKSMSIAEAALEAIIDDLFRELLPPIVRAAVHDLVSEYLVYSQHVKYLNQLLAPMLEEMVVDIVVEEWTSAYAHQLVKEVADELTEVTCKAMFKEVKRRNQNDRLEEERNEIERHAPLLLQSSLLTCLLIKTVTRNEMSVIDMYFERLLRRMVLERMIYAHSQLNDQVMRIRNNAPLNAIHAAITGDVAGNVLAQALLDSLARDERHIQDESALSVHEADRIMLARKKMREVGKKKLVVDRIQTSIASKLNKQK